MGRGARREKLKGLMRTEGDIVGIDGLMKGLLEGVGRLLLLLVVEWFGLWWLVLVCFGVVASFEVCFWYGRGSSEVVFGGFEDGGLGLGWLLYKLPKDRLKWSSMIILSDIDVSIAMGESESLSVPFLSLSSLLYPFV